MLIFGEKILIFYFYLKSYKILMKHAYVLNNFRNFIFPLNLISYFLNILNYYYIIDNKYIRKYNKWGK